jgi:hypothetical protein
MKNSFLILAFNLKVNNKGVAFVGLNLCLYLDLKWVCGTLNEFKWKGCQLQSFITFQDI